MIQQYKPKSNNILISGGTRGIGEDIARTLASAGHRVFVTSRNNHAPAPADGVSVIALDVCDPASVESCLQEVVEQAGPIDVLINNAGYDLYGAFEDTTWEEFFHQMDTNFFGAVRLTKAVIPSMRARGAGRIITISSLGGRIGLPHNGAYAASKFALEGLMESLRLEMLPFGVYVSLVVPAAVATDTLDTSILSVAKASAPHSRRLAFMLKKMRESGEKSSIHPAQVSQAVLRAVQEAKPLLSYTVGNEATFVPKMKALLPQRLFEAIMTSLFPNPKD